MPSWAAEDGAARAGERAFAPDYAGFWPRLAAKLVDGLVLYGPMLLVQAGVVATWFDGVAPELKEFKDFPEFMRLALYCLPFNTVIAAAYATYFISKYEATPGKRLLGLRVVRADGSRVGAARAFGRYFAERVSDLTFYAGYVMAAFDDEKRALHDCMCGTRVVKGARVELSLKAEEESGRGVNADGV
ncbi:MAG: RDD family protein, partial [Burkholderiales bacterium]|nr:RDD family protein [Opitutaceae bacterium]